MCEQCTSAAVTLGEPMPGVKLVRATRGDNMLGAGQLALARSDAPTFILPDEPETEPVPDRVDPKYPDHVAEWDAWFEKAERLGDAIRCDPMTGRWFAVACLKAGYRHKEGYLQFWLMDHLAKFVQKCGGLATPDGSGHFHVEKQNDLPQP